MNIILCSGDQIQGQNIVLLEGKTVNTGRLFEDDQVWMRVACTDPRAMEIFKRHYSYNPKRQNVPRFVGPGFEITLLSKDETALFVWQKSLYRADGQKGINCAVFRNENKAVKSSELIRSAEKIAWNRWPGERLFTYVDPEKVKSVIPGWCYIRARWKNCGISKEGKIIFEKNFIRR